MEKAQQEEEERQTKCSIKIHEILENPFVEYVEKVFETKYGHKKPLCDLHELLAIVDEKELYVHIGILGKDDRVCPFIHDFHHAVDKNDEFRELYHKYIQKEIMPLICKNKENKIVIQKTPNIRISLPEYAAIGRNPSRDDDEIIGYHKDADFGHFEEEINFIIPLTTMYDSNSIYYETKIESKKFINLKMDTSQMFQGYLNQLHHYNKKNTTPHTRMSFDLRVIPYDKYMENVERFKGTKFELGKYYVVLESVFV